MKSRLAFLIMRVGLGIVFLAFGIGKFRSDVWAETIRNMDFFSKLPWPIDVSVYLIGIAETLTGVALILGLFTRLFAALASLELIGILILLKFQEIRDVGLLGASIFTALIKDDSFGIDWLRNKIKGEAK